MRKLIYTKLIATLGYRNLTPHTIWSEHKSFVPHSPWQKQRLWNFIVKDSDVFLFFYKSEKMWWKISFSHKVIFYFLIKAYCPKVPRLFLYLFPFALFRGKETVKKNLSCLFASKNLHPYRTESSNIDKKPSSPSLIFFKLQKCLLLLCANLSATVVLVSQTSFS